MAGTIPQEFITQLLEHADIIDILSQKISLKKAGSSFKACCPFHHEKTPSFSVSQDKQVYHCFGCGVSGSTLQFIMDYDNLSFVDAVEELARFYHQDVPYEKSNYGNNSNNTTGQSNYKYKQTLSDILFKCAHYYRQTLGTNEVAKNYLKQRGLSADIVKQFQLGFSLNQWNQVDRLMPTEKENLIKAGMLIKNEKGAIYDRFRNRIMFPIINKQGSVIGFGGRSLSDEEKPKYLNSPESPTYDKSKELYGLYQAIKINRRPEALIIVEGYMDVIALAQNGIFCAIASLGTATSAYQIKDALRNCNTLIFCYDGDDAGQKAAWRAAETSLSLMKENLDIRFISLPKKDDPDTYTQQHGKAAFEQLMQNAQPLDDFILQTLKNNNSSHSLTAKTAFTDALTTCFNAIPEGTYKNLFAEKTNKNTNINLKIKAKKQVAKYGKRSSHIEMTSVRKLISFLIKDPSKSAYLLNNKEIFTLEQKGMNILAQICSTIIEKHVTNQASLLNLYSNKSYYAELQQLGNWQSANSENDSLEFQDIVNNFHNEYLSYRKKFLFDKLASNTLNTDEKEEIKQFLQPSVAPKSNSKHLI